LVWQSSTTTQEASAGASAFDLGQHLQASPHSHPASHAQVASASAQISLQASHGSDILKSGVLLLLSFTS